MNAPAAIERPLVDRPVRIGAEAYISPQYARDEADKLWIKVWQVACRAEFDRHHALASSKYALPVTVETMGGEYAYLDAQGETGHFLNYFIFPEDSHFAAVPRW